MAAYLDSSAIVKLVVREPESSALRRFLRAHQVRVSSLLAKVEVLRAVRRHGDETLQRARDVLQRIVLVGLDDDVLDAATQLDGAVLRSLDAIHLATALRLGPELETVLTYDDRMQTAALAAGLRFDAPSA